MITLNWEQTFAVGHVLAARAALLAGAAKSLRLSVRVTGRGLCRW